MSFRHVQLLGRGYSAQPSNAAQDGSAPHASRESTRIALQQNRSLGLWTAYVRRDDEVLAIIVDTDRDSVISSARRWICEAEPIAA